VVAVCEEELRFAEPLYLLLLIPALAGLAYSFRHIHGMAKGRKRFAFALRFLLLAALVVALAGPEARRPNEGICTMFVLDRSDSVSDAENQRALQYIDQVVNRLSPTDSAGIVAFGREAVVDASPAGRRNYAQVLSHVDPSASDLAAGIRLATASFPEGKSRRIVVLSDGNETAGDAADASQAAAADGIVIDHVALGQEDRRGEASVAGLEVPDESRVNQPIELRAIIDSTVGQTATVDLDRDGILIKRTPVRLTAGRNAIVLSDTLKATGFHRYRATLRANQDRDNRNNVGLGFVAVRGKPRVLVLQSKPQVGPLVEALRKNGIDTELGGPGSIPTKPEDFQAYDAVILNDLNADGVTVNQMKLIQSATRDSGVGLAMVGGEDSFLPGGWYGTPVAEALPVDLNVRQRKSFPSTSILIMADASGSMGMPEDGVMKIRLAANAAEQTINMMSPMDRGGVAGSTDGIEFVAPMQKLTDKPAVIAQIRKLNVGGGGIYIRPSMEKAEEVLSKEPSKVRHFILLADGNDSDEQEGAIAIALRMRAEKITTTVVAIGDGKDIGFLKTLAVAGGGRYYLAKKASQLPAIFTQDASIMSRSAIEEGAFVPKMALGEPILRGIDAVPPLLAYCLADTRPLSRVGMRTGKDDPLLATWQYGLGSSLAFTSDAQARWASKWVGWEGFGAFWSQAVREISRRSTRNRYQMAVHNDGGKGRLEVKAFDSLGNPLTATNAKVRVAGPNGDFAEVPISQTAPGVYSGAFAANDIGSYIVTVAEPDQAGGQRVSATGFSVPYPPEYRTSRPNLPLLTQMSDVSGGQALAKPEDALRPIKDPGASISELWPFFILFAALLLPLDIATRRIALPVGEMVAKALAWLRLRRRPAPTAPAVVERLQRAKARVQAPVGEAPTVSERPAPVSRPTVEAPAADDGLTPAERLLEAKRKRRG
jgi:Ca-activated chloride channel homolog